VNTQVIVPRQDGSEAERRTRNPRRKGQKILEPPCKNCVFLSAAHAAIRREQEVGASEHAWADKLPLFMQLSFAGFCNLIWPARRESNRQSGVFGIFCVVPLK
jgi:hypothetical protein